MLVLFDDIHICIRIREIIGKYVDILAPKPPSQTNTKESERNTKESSTPKNDDDHGEEDDDDDDDDCDDGSDEDIFSNHGYEQFRGEGGWIHDGENTIDNESTKSSKFVNIHEDQQAEATSKNSKKIGRETNTQEKDKNKAQNNKTKHGLEKIEKDKVI
uniref:Uncharacterized protein n=1 Tax=Tanacetum cinerariifolium TaxID=118510 RepID=A0A6L2K3C9_TANCI|nr:hypothetical protein [Tanacetum cinerariifolium]